MASETFGPSALATPANAITAARLLLTPVFLLLAVEEGPGWGVLTAWILLAGTDGVDGYVARRHGTTRSGAFLDPLADKFLVLGALVTLTATDLLPGVPVALIAVREVTISVYRACVGRRGISVPARYWAKVKTVVQAVAVGLALLPPPADVLPLASACLWVATVLALVTGVQYLLDGRRAARAV